MSSILKETKTSLVGEEVEAAEVPDWFIRYLYGALKNPLFSVPKPFETWMIDKVGSSGFDVPISQIVGFTQFLGQSDTKGTVSETTTSVNTPANLATVGPELTGLPDGEYLILFGAAAAHNSAGANTFMGVKVNSTEPADIETAFTQAAAPVPLMRAVQKVLSNDGNNTLLCRYYVGSASTATYYYRWLIALKIANA
jgi:hypothetical protein